MSKTMASGRRFILYHKHHASARTRFLCFANRTVLFPEPLPELSQRYDDTVPAPPRGVVMAHPAMLLRQLTEGLKMDVAELELEPQFVEQVDTAAARVDVHLVRFTAIDPPFELAQNVDGTFIDLTQARHLPGTELQLLRRAYEVIMEG